MASLIRKIKKGKAYWYAVECRRVDGKPRIAWQKYLGRADDILKATQAATAPPPQEVLLRQFGAVAALLDVAGQLDVIGTIDRHVRKRHQGASIGQYLLLAAINRACDPKSKLQIGEWYQQTVLGRLWKLPVETFSSQRFWDAMDAVHPEAIAAIERDLVDRLLKTVALDLRAILYDTTNFATFIHTLNDRNGLAQRGHAKSKRHDLRLVGLALVVTRTFGIPLLHETYAGNVNDSTQFGSLALQLAERYRQLASTCQDLTLVFDKGNNSEDNFTLLGMEQVHFVASLVASQHSDLLEIPLEQYQPLQGDEWAGVRAYRCQRDIFGQSRTVVVTFSESFFSQQAQALLAGLAKAVRQLDELAKRLRVWHSPRQGQRKPAGRPPGRSAVERQVAQILSAQHMRQLVRTEIGDTPAGVPKLNFTSDQDALHRLIERICGKTVLFTDRQAWSNEQIVAAYRGQSGIEERFRDMNHWDFLRWSPMYHWTDQKIRVHAFYCVLALLLVGVLRKRLSEGGIDLPPHALLDSLGKILETVVIYPPAHPPSPPRLAATLSRLDPQQKSLYNALNLAKWRSSEG
jgi:transposase